MADYEYYTVDVFTERRFGGNPLAVFPAAAGLDTATMQALSAEMNYSETSFVLPPADPANDAQVRIFNRTSEMPFAGHPNVGTAFVLAQLGLAQGRTLRFEEIAGLVEVRLTEEAGAVIGAEIDAPQPLSLQGELPPAEIAACLSVPTEAIVLAEHTPIRASVGVNFVVVAVKPDALTSATPNIAAYRRLADGMPDLGGRLSIFVYAPTISGVRARMFAPLAGTWEDPATGSANATLAALRLSLSGEETLAYEAIQGVEMGRESRLAVRAWRTDDGIRASVGGRCVSVFTGKVSL
ncbi:MAG: PhzF family phenazine biosynthesis protein [Sphingomonas sp.]|jgi:trans-2,3-dihydro-3-hydroxyanthranilate isomerase|uniref:PhzF family phenazine biosynthesis protein n=1 Tax=Sphingomonas sp. TaxID=28214 RepID=UPI003566FB79